MQLEGRESENTSKIKSNQGRSGDNSRTTLLYCSNVRSHVPNCSECWYTFITTDLPKANT